MAAQPHSHIATQLHSYIATATQLHSHKGGGLRPPPFLCGYVAMWLCGSVAMWLCSNVAIWLCGYVAMWLSGPLPLSIPIAQRCRSYQNLRELSQRRLWGACASYEWSNAAPTPSHSQQKNLGDFRHSVGWGGGNRYVEGDLLTFGYLMLNDSLGYPYFRLFIGNP